MPKRLYYGWIVIAVSFLVFIFTFGVQQSFGVFLKPLQEEFEWSRAMVSWVPGLCALFAFALAPFSGWFTDRYGPKIMVGIGGFFIGLGLVLSSHVGSPWQIYIFYSVIVGLGLGCIGTPLFTTVSRWFVERRGLAIGIASSGTGLGNMVMPPVARYFISAYGWRTSYLVIGFAVWVIITCSGLLLKKEPREIESLSYGRTHNQRMHNEPLELDGLTAWQALRTSTFWLLTLVAILGMIGVLMVMYHLVACAEDMGVPKMTAATFLSVIGATSIAGRISVGMASDRLGRKKLYIFCFLLQAIMMLWLTKLASVWMFYLFAAIWGFSFGGMNSVFAALVAELFGLQHMGVVFGLITFIMGISSVGGPALAGYIFDATGSYSIAFLIGAIVMFLSAMILPLLKAPSMG
jgi:MFS family permease